MHLARAQIYDAADFQRYVGFGIGLSSFVGTVLPREIEAQPAVDARRVNVPADNYAVEAAAGFARGKIYVAGRLKA